MSAMRCPSFRGATCTRSANLPAAAARSWELQPQLNEISYLPLKEGRWLNDLDGIQRRNVIVLGNELFKTLFPGQALLGSFVLINGLRFEVVGSLPHSGARRQHVAEHARLYSLSGDGGEFPAEGRKP